MVGPSGRVGRGSSSTVPQTGLQARVLFVELQVVGLVGASR